MNHWQSLSTCKKIGYPILLVLLILALFNWELINYGIAQGKGQANILWNAQPIEKVLSDPNFPDSLKTKLRYIQEVREYAIDSLGLEDSDSYKSVFDQKGKPILWVVTACQPYALDDYKWSFPFLGELSYKGYFVKHKADTLEAELLRIGLDTDVGEVTAWSTLGWFNDPILTGMLDDSEGMLARLIIHELTHATLYIASDVDFNENLATFVGDQGAYLFLEHKYGKDSPEYQNYAGRLADIQRFGNHVFSSCNVLDSLYTNLPPHLYETEKQAIKTATIQRIVNDADTISFYNKERYQKVLTPKKLPNNTFFMGFRRYRKSQNTFEIEFKEKFNSNFDKYLKFLKEKYG